MFKRSPFTVYFALIPLAVIQMQGLEEACTHTVQYMGLQQAKGVERSNEAIE